MGSPRNLIVELRRRRVFRTAGLYVVACWVLLQVADLAFQSLNIPDTALVWVWVAALICFPLALIFGWRYDIVADGIRRTLPLQSGQSEELSLRRSDYLILTALAVVAIVAGFKLIVEIGDVERRPSSKTVSTVVPANSIAVLPLDNLSGDPQQEFFVSGMHEALIADLSRISGLKVISRTSTEQYRDSARPLPEIGAELGVAKLIEGSVFRDGDQVRITVQLIDAATDEHLWAESYERDLTNVLRLQSNLARAIADQVKVTLTPYEDILLASSAQVDPVAYELYLKGRFHWYKFTEADLQLALEYFQKAIDKDPNYALAYVGFADALATPAHIGLMPTTKVYPAAKQSLQRALELDKNLAEAHDLRARIDFAYDWDWDAAERGFRRAISLNPGYPDAHVVYSQFLAVTNRWDESLEEVKTGLELDPLNPWYQLEVAQRLAWFGRHDEARDKIGKLIERQPDWWAPHKYLWYIAQEQGQYEEAVTEAGIYFRLLGETAIAELLEQGIREQDYRELMQRAADLLETHSVRPYLSHIDHAQMRMHSGELDRALDHLEEAYAEHESHLVYTIAEPLFRPIWNNERYKKLLSNMNYK
jgi:TolB-like protein